MYKGLETVILTKKSELITWFETTYFLAPIKFQIIIAYGKYTGLHFSGKIKKFEVISSAMNLVFWGSRGEI